MGRSAERQRHVDKHSDEYASHRKKNNDAVQKSRKLSRQKSKAVVDRIKELTDENKCLEDKIKRLTEELCALQSMYSEKQRRPSLSDVAEARLDQLLRTEHLDVPLDEDFVPCSDDDEDSVPDFEAITKNRN
ncbi:unnamed protein product [Notodromas monacha]|uniref:BZIP domain-containing protein n=1 Tax=Notodromas monacha TaxID=399045 RepID=A0A7R9GFG3_9CRUS|nr:unnamed protein product [Notodromas monacha]CAG0920757.1 unnamed protein product [Notodromas monacha]